MRKEILAELQIIINQTKIIANISPGSIEETIYKECYKAFRDIQKGGIAPEINFTSLSRQYADKNGYTAPLLTNLSKVEKMMKLNRKNEGYE